LFIGTSVRDNFVVRNNLIRQVVSEACDERKSSNGLRGTGGIRS